MISSTVKTLKSVALAVPLALAPALSAVVLNDLGLPGFQGASAQAQEQKKEERKTRKTPTMSEKVYKQLSVVQELVDASKLKEGLAELKEINTEKFNSYEKAQVLNYYGFIYYQMERYKESMKAFRDLLAQPDIPLGLETSTRYTLAQLCFVNEDYKCAVNELKTWMDLSPIVGSDAHILLAQAYYQLEDMTNALKHTNIAVDNYESQVKNPDGTYIKVPKENWYALQRALYFDKNDYKQVAAILEKMIRYYNNPTYWRQLSGIYAQMDRELDQLHALDAAYVGGNLTGEKDLLNLAYIYMGSDVPYKAAQIITKGIKDKLIKPDAKIYLNLGQAWQMAQELDEAMKAYAESAKLSGNSETWARLAGVYLDNDRFEDAAKAARNALKDKDLKRPDQLQVILGTALVYLHEWDDARKAFKAAAKEEKSRRMANSWLQHVDAEQKRYEFAMSLGVKIK